MSQRERIKVAVRVRPLLNIKTEINTEDILKVDQNAASILCQTISNVQQFTYDYAFPQDCTQLEVYEQSAKEIVDSVLEGYNGTIFAYGQTGSGKTYTMYGIGDGPIRGILPRAISQIFDYVDRHKPDTEFDIKASYIQIYEDKILDLLNNDIKNAPKIKLKEDPSRTSFQMENNIIYSVNNIDVIKYILSVGAKNKKFRKTNMNVASSRAHTILTIWIKQSSSDKKIFSRLNLVDLAGSESAKKAETEGEGFIEATAINSSLLVLGNCISALTSLHNKKTVVPYRENPLTKLLKDSLGGNARTLMIATLSPSSYNANETLNTMWYAQKAKSIKNKAIINMDPKDSLIIKYKSEVQNLEDQIEFQRTAIESNDACNHILAANIDAENDLRSEISSLKRKTISMEKEIANEEKKIKKEKKKHKKLIILKNSSYETVNKFEVNSNSDKLDEDIIENKNNENDISELKHKREQLKIIQSEITNKQRMRQKQIDELNSIAQKLTKIVKSNISSEKLKSIYKSSTFDAETQQWKFKSSP